MASRTSTPVGYCLKVVREAYGVDAKYGSAATAWRNADSRHSSQPPRRGYPCFWQGGSSGNGHVAIGLGDGYILSTDLPYGGHVGRVWWTEPSRQWGLTYAGWTYDLNEVSVWCHTVDLSEVRYAAQHAPHKNSNVKPVEQSLHARGYLAAFRVNSWWNTYTSTAYRKWEDRLNATQDGIPGLGGLRQLGRLKPYMIVRP
jgi:hypothetical protein